MIRLCWIAIASARRILRRSITSKSWFNMRTCVNSGSIPLPATKNNKYNYMYVNGISKPGGGKYLYFMGEIHSNVFHHNMPYTATL